MSQTMCSNCGEPASGRHSLPVGRDGGFVSIPYIGEWGAVPSCEACHDLHAVAGEHGPAVLKVYERVTEETLQKLADARAAIARMYDTALVACRECEVDR